MHQVDERIMMMDGHDDPTTDSRLAWTLAIGFLHEACRYMGNHNLVTSFGKWTHPYIFEEGVKIKPRVLNAGCAKEYACFFFFSLHCTISCPRCVWL
jgi:hypothetical protein